MKSLSSRILRLTRLRADAVAREVQEMGLAAAARLAATLMGERLADEPGALAPWQVEVLRAIMDRLCAYDDPQMPPPATNSALKVTLEFVGFMPPESRQQIADLLVLMEAGPLVLGPRRHRFTTLGPSDQDAFLASWEQSSLPPRRAAFRALKSVCMMGYWTRPGTWEAIGYGIHNNPGVPPRIGARHMKEEGHEV